MTRFLPTAKAWAAAAALASAVGAFSSAYATPVTGCDVLDATANGAIADECAFSSTLDANPSAETAFVNDSFTGVGTADDFAFAAKYDKESGSTSDGLTGWTLTVSDRGEDYLGSYRYQYTLTVPSMFLGTTADFVLLIKQATDSTIAYLFNDVTLGIEGDYNNFWINPNENIVNDYSHISGLIRTETPQDVPEPDSLALLGLGLVALAVVLRRRRA